MRIEPIHGHSDGFRPDREWAAQPPVLAQRILDRAYDVQLVEQARDLEHACAIPQRRRKPASSRPLLDEPDARSIPGVQEPPAWLEPDVSVVSVTGEIDLETVPEAVELQGTGQLVVERVDDELIEPHGD